MEEPHVRLSECNHGQITLLPMTEEPLSPPKATLPALIALGLTDCFGVPCVLQTASATAPQAQLPLQPYGRVAALARRYQLDGKKSLRQPSLDLLERLPGHNRMLLAARSALLDESLLLAPGLAMPAAASTKPLGPTCPDQVDAAPRIHSEALEKSPQRSRQALQQLVRHGEPFA
jgi:hypothetical protein